MDIPNLAKTQPIPTIQSVEPKKPSPNKNSKIVLLIIVILATVSGFWISRFWPSSSQSSNSIIDNITQKDISSAEDIKSQNDIVVGKYYGDTAKTFKDSATGTIEKGSINGEGTHILNREGGKTQRASLTSSVIDLDLFIDKKVEVKGETNSSNKTGWLMDVGVIKVIE